MEKNITANHLKEMLAFSKIGDRKNAIKHIEKNRDQSMSLDVIELLKTELTTNKSWDFIVAIINCLGKLKAYEAKELLYNICQGNKEHDMITASAAKAFCIISRKSNVDVDGELELLSFGKFSVINGALKSLAEEKVIPDEQSRLKILSFIKDFSPYREKGYSDIRMGLAAACAGWLQQSEAKIFLEDCLESDFSPLVKIAQMSLRGKYSSLN